MEKATLFCIMDGSGSMGHTKKMLSKKYYSMFKGMLEGRYDNVDTRFIAHTTVAREVYNTDEVWYRGEGGGTYLSSGVVKALDIINNEIDTDKSDVFTLIFSDGDNWGEDNETMIEETRKLCGLCNKVEFLEVNISTYTSSIKKKLDEEVNEPTFESFSIHDKKDVSALLPQMFSQEFGDNKGKSLKAKDQDRMNTYGDILSIARDGRRTIVVLKDGSVGIALKHPNDKHDDEIGFQVARLKAEIESNKLQLQKLF